MTTDFKFKDLDATEKYVIKLRKMHTSSREGWNPVELEEGDRWDDLITLAEIGLSTLKEDFIPQVTDSK